MTSGSSFSEASSPAAGSASAGSGAAHFSTADFRSPLGFGDTVQKLFEQSIKGGDDLGMTVIAQNFQTLGQRVGGPDLILNICLAASHSHSGLLGGIL